MSYNSTPRRIYIVAQISMSSGILQVDKLINVPYQSVRHVHPEFARFSYLHGCEKDFQSFGSSYASSTSAYARRCSSCSPVWRRNRHLLARFAPKCSVLAG